MAKRYHGTSIIEVVIAAALISISVIAALSLSNHSQKQNTYARDLAEASKYLAEGSDWLRSERDELGWATIASKVASDVSEGVSTYCLNTLPNTQSQTDFTDISAGSCDPSGYITETIFQREVTIAPPEVGSDILKATILVKWIEKEERQATLDVELTQW